MPMFTDENEALFVVYDFGYWIILCFFIFLSWKILYFLSDLNNEKSGYLIKNHFF